jgi:hypothetical protein
MSYNIGQFRRTDIGTSNYEKDVDKTITTGLDENNDGVILFREGLSAGEIYRLQATLKSTNLPSNTKIKIKLKDSNNKYQILKIINISSSYKLNLIFIPQYNFEKIVFEIDRISNASISQNARVSAEQIKLTSMTNIISELGNNITRLKRVGIQGPEGMSFVINGELLKMGKSRIFMSDEMEITSVCFIIEDLSKTDPFFMENNIPFFIMDYQY